MDGFPVYEGSVETLKSGMLFQIDIIPSVSGYPGTSAESTVVLADAELKARIPERISADVGKNAGPADVSERNAGHPASEDVLPMFRHVAYFASVLIR